jgi:hypothetical protein
LVKITQSDYAYIYIFVKISDNLDFINVISAAKRIERTGEITLRQKSSGDFPDFYE